ncbi:hypothetical protein [Paraburkholderia terrae]|uniref:hypothetical protein n=1 Tax=Paraburkholderia terrae TaxID=311230 RepID=UPI0020C02461|nr:hypothetical protein [Paraburkholderia terrae]
MKAFVAWLVERLPGLKVRLQFPHSKFVPGGIDAIALGIEDVLTHYRWSATWIDSRTGDNVDSCDWASTRRALERLSAWLRESVANGDELAARAAALAVLRWGGVRGAIPFIERKVRKSAWCAYLNELAPLFVLDGDQTLDALNARKVERFDSGLTKIHALLDVTGSPIYDSRVGAALAMLYEMFRREKGLAKEPPVAARFPSGQARGRQIRNPGDLGLNYAASPQFYTQQVSHADWARWQLRAGWIIRAVLERTTLFANAYEDETARDIATRCHAFEAALFMVGYDLRSLADGEPPIIDGPDGPPLVPEEGGNWVPTSHPFRDVLSAYRAYRETQPADFAMNAFKEWLNGSLATEFYTTFAKNFTSYRYPLGEREFDLVSRSMEDIRLIEAGQEQGLYVAYNGEREFIAGDEREQVCLVCAGLTGYCYTSERTADARAERLICTGFAGTENAANTLLTVGRAVGRHFGLLDGNNQPTEFFGRFFSDGFSDFRDRLRGDR